MGFRYRKGVFEKFKKIFLSNRGDIVSVYYGFLSCLKYQDVKIVYLFSIIEFLYNIEIGFYDFYQNLVKIRFFMVYIYDQKMDVVDRYN